MEYGESIISGGVTKKVTCQSCGCEEHKLTGVIRYLFFFLESLPFIPVNKKPIVQCTSCDHIYENSNLPSNLLREFSQQLFPFYRLLHKFIGLFLLLALFVYWAQAIKQEQFQAQTIIAAPKVNDFLYINYRMLEDDLRPNENYRIAKIVDITDDVVSVVFGKHFYKYQKSLASSMRSGRIGSSKYFERKRYEFSRARLKEMLQTDAIYNAKRPVGNMLFGNPVIDTRRVAYSSVYYPGARQNIEGLAFEKASYIDGHMKTAFERFKASAEVGFVPGQINLARFYIAGGHQGKDLNLALYWLKQAALQSYKPAIYKYATVCKKVDSCDINIFYQELIENGVAISFNS